jgi:hypothetical protein
MPYWFWGSTTEAPKASGQMVAGCTERLFDHCGMAGCRHAQPIKPSVPTASSRGLDC